MYSKATLEICSRVLHKPISKCHTMAFDTKRLFFTVMCWLMAVSKIHELGGKA